MMIIVEETAGTTSSVEFGLDKAQQGRSYMIVSSSATGRSRMRMDALGLLPGDAVHVLFANFSGLVVAIKGSRLALGRSLAVQLTVREFQDSDWQDDVTP
jgi:Fe2+ transport system protein FeoA